MAPRRQEPHDAGGPGARGAGGGARRGRPPQLGGDRARRRGDEGRAHPRRGAVGGAPARRRGRRRGAAPAARGPGRWPSARTRRRHPAPSWSAGSTAILRPRRPAATSVPPAHPRAAAPRARHGRLAGRVRGPAARGRGAARPAAHGRGGPEQHRPHATGVLQLGGERASGDSRPRPGRGGDADGRQRRLQRRRGRPVVRPVHAGVGDRVRPPRGGGDARADERRERGPSTGRPRPPPATRSSTGSSASRTSPWSGPPAPCRARATWTSTRRSTAGASGRSRGSTAGA